MKWNHSDSNNNGNVRARIIGKFGEATLIEQANGRHELVGGRPGDLTAAQEWASLFAHELVFSQVDRPRANSWPARG